MDDRAGFDLVFGSKRDVRVPVFSIARAYGAHSRSAQLGGVLTLTNRYACAAFSMPILHVVEGCTDKQVVRSDTRWIVAMVANIQPFRDGSVRERPCESMSGDVLRFADVKGTVPARLLDGSKPRPTAVTNTDTTPKAEFKTRIDLHQGATSSLVLPAVVHSNRRPYCMGDKFGCR